MFFIIEFFLTNASYQFLKNDWIFISHSFLEKIFSTTLLFLILKVNFSVAEIKQNSNKTYFIK